MLPPDAQRLAHIRDYCLEIRKTIERYGESFEPLTATLITNAPCPSAFYRSES